MTIHPALRAQLEHLGLWNAEGVSRAARARHCARCGQTILTGLDHDRTALTARCDPTPLDPAGELTALLAGRATYTLRRIGGRYELDRRSPESIQAKPAGHPANQFDVLAAHECETAITPTVSTCIPEPVNARKAEQCPF